MTPSEIVGVSLYSEVPKEIIDVIERNISQRDEDVIAACAHAIGHLVRRFPFDVSSLRDKLIQQSKKFGKSDFLSAAILDMDNDITHFSRN
ncbi:hypothetical protein [Brucella intermedia]|nr:hypothetical protein [Brucella intermedia]KAB2672115.1 hypothetical protein F9K77_01895 [Ochrobactrum sp. LMG 5442]PJR87974.1 hypothetical protein CN881_22700 [Ochrobactrum sp. 721/2009]PJT16840.1 hypothetical protein CN880_11020 [Ochrobactrum sp. 720/2009]PJT28058.1 hypothetical protein CN878_20035 [Ochrobactrum sp. 695/2009]PJT31857.1 hypothetical protein CN877_22705 [Ochrobactrum sp. 689/2009]